MRLKNEYLDRFRGADITPTKDGINSKLVYVTGYNEKGEKVIVRKEDDVFYNIYNEPVTIEIWEYTKEYKHVFYNIKKNKPKFKNGTKYIIGVDSYGNEFLVYQKNNKLHMHCNDKEAFIIMWRYICKFRVVNL